MGKVYSRLQKNLSSYTGGFIYCIPGNLEKGSVQFVKTVVQMEDKYRSRSLNFAILARQYFAGFYFRHCYRSKYEKRALKFAI